MAKVIMIQGTMSNAGKSILAAGLCRIFSQDGYKVAPFKAQNMALNSYITKDGLEMGRAQVVQAQAAGVEPSVAMNPILLKPSNDTGSQVIVNGIPIGNMEARAYFQYKKELVPVVLEAYRKLEADYDIIVIEGAGSPAEINLKKDDIVNMGMAKLAHAPVLLAGDIDRGGVFAQLYGTVELLEPREREMIKGLIINKFRGDRTILDPGVEMIEKLCGIPVVGVVPFMDVDIEDEDSLSSRLEENHQKSLIDIAVIRFPRISNFTDFNVFSCQKAVGLHYIDSADKLGNPDMIILPGTKNTIDDLLWMRQNGIESLVMKAASKGVPVFGVCGGYQMMGKRLFDEDGTESGTPGKNIMGMGLFPLVTRFEEEKTRTRVVGHFTDISGILKKLSGVEVEGYEIHMGRTWMAEASDVTEETSEDTTPHGLLTFLEQQKETREEKIDGYFTENLYGTYVHGIFDKESVAETIVTELLKEKGYEEASLNRENFDYAAYREEQFDKLAAELRKSLDMKQVYEILKTGV